MDPLRQYREDEHEAWKDTATTLRELLKDSDLNSPENDVLIKKIRVWGETVAAMRCEQQVGQRWSALRGSKNALALAQDSVRRLKKVA